MTVLYAIIAIIFMIFIHELGHFAVGKWCGAHINEFAIGMGPRLLSKKWGETTYSIRILPLGGYCAFDADDSTGTIDSSLNTLPIWKRFLIVFGGPALNFLTAIIVFWGVGFSQNLGFIDAIVYGFDATWHSIQSVFASLNGLFITKEYSFSDVSGVVGVVSTMGEYAKTSMADFFILVGLLSANLGVMNLLPIPALDGFKLLSYIAEFITKKRIPQKVETILTVICMIVLIAFMILVNIKDVITLF